MSLHFRRAFLVIAILAAVGLAACIVRTSPGHRHHGSHVHTVKHKKHQAYKHKKHKKHRKHN